MTTPPTAAVVLAAGRGSRFAGSGSKLLATVRGRSVVTWAVEAAVAAGLPATVVVTGAVDVGDALPENVTVVENPDWSLGQATSLQVGLRWAGDHGYDAVVVGLGDQPFVGSAAWRAVAASSSPIAVATYGGRRRNPVRLAREVWPLLPDAGDEGARAVFARLSNMVTEVPCDGDPGDIDTVEDLQAWS